MAQNYNDTIHKMQTPFEMRAGLPKKEPKMLEDWEQNHVYEQMIKNNEGKPQYILHDGPPYANGSIHMGTALNKIIKDIIIRYKNMSGFQAPYVPGYDTHGLPIELKALSSLGDKKAGVSKLELRQICKEFATEHIGVMNEQFKRLGVQGDFENPYLTLRPEFEARQVEIFGEMARKGYIYKGMKAVYWCPEDRTALAEAEIEYAEDECDSIYVRFKLTDDPNGVLAKHNIPLDKAWIVIWTTTTWTLPANVATCLNPNLEYAFVKIGDAYHIMARELVESTMKGCHIDEYEVLPETVLGSELELMQYQHPFLDRKGLVILGDHVTLEGGTGCVHTAPGHGVEDFEVCVNHYPQVPVVVPVDDAGRLTAEAGEKFAGLKVWDANKVILEHIKESGHLMGVQHITHQYPHCWRCHHPIIFRATEQWFCSIDAFKEDVYKAIDSVHWQPAWGHDRMAGMVRDRSDWCISRQRVWGVPIPVFYCKKCGKYHITDASIKAVSDLFRKEGSDAWYKYDANDILPKTEVCECGASDWEKDPDIMDVWFDSGSTWSAVCRERPELRWPVDMYMEGADQFRGWFQSSLLTSVATQGVAPYREVLCHGWVVDAQGKQMHKSAGNGMEPSEIIRDYGADSVRMYEMFMGPLTESKPWATQGFIGVYRFLDRVWRISTEKKIEDVEIPMDLNKTLHKTIRKVTEDTATLNFNTAISSIMELVNEMYKYRDGEINEALYGTAVRNLVVMLAPFVPHVTEEMWEHLEQEGSVHNQMWPEFDESALVKDTVEIVVQINGKIKEKMNIAGDLSREEMQKVAMEDEKVKALTEGKNVVKVIAVPNKLINIVVK